MTRGRIPTHGHSHRGKPSPTYNSWRGMIERCRPDRAYGRRGIRVCPQWLTFAGFLADMGERPKGHELDRENPRGDYTPKNCSWLLKRTNRQYRSTTKLAPRVREIVLQLRADGVSHAAIAALISASKTAVGEFLRGQSWA